MRETDSLQKISKARIGSQTVEVRLDSQILLFGGLLLLVAFINTQPAHLQTAVASKEEQELLAEINLAREHPQDYAAFIETYYNDQQTKEGPSNVAEVVRILKSTAAAATAPVPARPKPRR